MKQTISSLALIGLFVFLLTAAPASAQQRLVAQNAVLAETTISPEDPAVWPSAPIVSPEIMSLDVPPIPTSGYVQFTSSVVWQVFFTPDAPVRTNFMLRFELTSAAFPSGMGIRFVVPMTLYRNNAGTGVGFQGGTGVDSEVYTRDLLTKFLVAGNEGLSEAAARSIIDDVFRTGFHVSVSAQLRSQNVTDAVASNTNVAFFAEQGSNHQ